MMDFKSLHPLITFVYFAVIIIFSMVSHNPFIVAISAVSAVLYNLLIKKSIKSVLFVLPLMFFTAVFNPVFSHKGATILFYWGNPITLESILYGIGAAFMLLAVIMWFGVFNVIMTGDKIMYIFGRIMPKVSLIISMTLSVVPRLKNQFNIILESQKLLGNDMNKGSFVNKIKVGGRIILSLTGWLLEDAVLTSDAMEARGYGSHKRTSYTIYSFTTRDKSVFLIVAVLSVFVAFGFYNESLRFEYYPVIYCENISRGIIYYFCFFVLAFLPVVYDCLEVAKWKLLKSKI